MKISPLIKNNKTLIAVLVITFVCACVMIFECLSVYGNVQEIMTMIEEEDAEIQRINKAQNPNPVKKSESIIQDNTERLRLRIRDIRRKIGNPYREALKDFLRNLESSAFLKSAPLPPKEFVDSRGPAAPAAEKDTVSVSLAGKDPVELHFTEDEIRASFASLFNEYYSDRKNADSASARDGNERLVEEHNELFDKFREKLIQPSERMEFASDDERKAYQEGARLTFEKAFYRFYQMIQENTIEEIIEREKTADGKVKKVNLAAAKSIFLDALGLPRTMTSFQCKTFVDAFSNSIRKNPTVIPGLSSFTGKSSDKGSDGGLEARIQAFTFNHKNMLPPPGNVVHILRHYRILEDLFRRMREANIQYLTNVASPFSEKPTGDLSGDVFREMGADYRKFSYEVTVVSAGSEIRDFVNLLHHAFNQNLVYDIQEISFQKTVQLDDVKPASEKVSALRKSSEKPGENSDSASRTEAEGAAGGSGSAPNGGTAAVPRSPEEIYTDPEYGNVLVGQHELVQAVIKFNYILYVGEMLGKKVD